MGAITQLGIQTLPGTKFYLNNSNESIVVNNTGIFELDLEDQVQITALRFYYDSLRLISEANLVKDNNTALLDIIHNTERCEVIYIPLDDIMEYVAYANNILHPDEVIFVTGNRDYIDIANTYLGNEMIKFIG